MALWYIRFQGPPWWDSTNLKNPMNGVFRSKERKNDPGSLFNFLQKRMIRITQIECSNAFGNYQTLQK